MIHNTTMRQLLSPHAPYELPTIFSRQSTDAHLESAYSPIGRSKETLDWLGELPWPECRRVWGGGRRKRGWPGRRWWCSTSGGTWRWWRWWGRCRWCRGRGWASRRPPSGRAPPRRTSSRTPRGCSRSRTPFRCRSGPPPCLFSGRHAAAVQPRTTLISSACHHLQPAPRLNMSLTMQKSKVLPIRAIL